MIDRAIQAAKAVIGDRQPIDYMACTVRLVMSAKRVGSYFVLMRQWGMVKLSRPKEIHHAPF
jgi:hypothetical protein